MSEDSKIQGLAQRLDQTAQRPYRPSDYLRRLAWKFIERLLIRPSLPRAANWRNFWLRRFGARIAHGASIRPGTHVMHPWLLTLGRYSTIAERARVYNLGRICVGEHTVISQGAYLCAGTHDYTKVDLPLQRPPIEIGSGVWICTEAFIGPGVHIGDNSVVGARSVVVQDVPPGVVVAGNPANVIKPRFPGND